VILLLLQVQRPNLAENVALDLVLARSAEGSEWDNAATLWDVDLSSSAALILVVFPRFSG